MVKIRFALDPTDWHGFASETLWAKAMGHVAGANAFEIRNSPFYAKGVSYLDIVRAVETCTGLTFQAVIARGGHSTYRILIDEGSPNFQHWWEKLGKLGCTYESGDFRGKKLLSIDMAPSVDVHKAYAIMEEGERRSIWIFEEGHFAMPGAQGKALEN